MVGVESNHYVLKGGDNMGIIKDFIEYRRGRTAEKATVEAMPSQLVEWQNLAA